ncbi:MAG: DUF5654 family protein [Methanomassiliicoccales archaeon]|nr:DUF5654 family protein [Methanomassiliicoccales archaeon]
MSFKLEVIDKIAALMTAAFGMIAALAWNEAIKSLMIDIFGTASGTMGFLIYAIIVTVFAVAAIIMITRTYNKIKTREEVKAK